jgi:hypothetical protein
VTHPLSPLARELSALGARYVVIGVTGANLYAPAGQAVFTTRDIDLFLPLDADNLRRTWQACEQASLDLWTADEPLDRPRDRWLADQVIQRRALTTAKASDGLLIDLTLVMAGFEFETVWNERREFLFEGIPVPTARLLHIVESKQAAGRPKDQLFLATHKEALEQLLKRPE